MLDERKIKLIELILAGENKTNIAKIIGISRQAVYDWLNDPEVIREMERTREEMLQAGKEKLTSRLDTYLDVLHKLATTSTDKRTQASCAMYLTDRILGKVSTIIEAPPEKKESLSHDILAAELDEWDKEELKVIK